MAYATISSAAAASILLSSPSITGRRIAPIPRPESFKS